MSTQKLCALRLPSEYRLSTPERERIFPSDNALHWHMRTKRDELVSCGALRKIRGVWFINEAKFDDHLLNGAKRAA